VTPAGRLAAAIELLSEAEAAPNRPADAVASAYFRARRFIGGTDRRSISGTVWHALRTWRHVGWWLARAGDAKVTPRVRVAALHLLDGTPMAELERLFSGGRFAPATLDAAEHAILRAIDGHTLQHPAMPPAVRFEIPDWLLPHLRARFGERLGTEINALAGEAPLDLRVNLLKGTRAEALDLLRAEGRAVEPTALSPWGLRLGERQPITTGAAFQSGLVEIQDEGSQLVAALVGARPGMRVVDYCAGAAGKTLAMAMTMENRGHIVACDVSAPRLDGAVRRLRRAGAHNVERHLIEPGDKWSKRRARSFDRVLVDAPCTGIGTWRRNPDARIRLAEADLHELVAKQAAILDSAAPLVRIGGRLVYATCSMLTEENEAQVTAFLSRHADFALVPATQAWTLPDPPPCDGGYLVLTPARNGTDGFFGAVLERTA